MKGWPRNVLAEVWDSELFPCDSLKSRVLRTGSVDSKSRFVGKPYLGITSRLPVIRPESPIKYSCNCLLHGSEISVDRSSGHL